jgi:hypothetical protein
MTGRDSQTIRAAHRVRSRRILATFGLSAALAVGVAAEAKAALPPPLWIELQKTTSDYAYTIPVVDGKLDIIKDGDGRLTKREYSNGKRIPLSNWMPPRPPAIRVDGEAYIQIQAPDAVDEDGQATILARHMFIGVKIPRKWSSNPGDPSYGFDNGRIQLFLEKNASNESCLARRTIEMTFGQEMGIEPWTYPYGVDPDNLSFVTTEASYSAGCSSPPTPQTHYYLQNSSIKVMLNANGEPTDFLFAEFDILLDGNTFNINLNPGQNFYFGLAYWDTDYIPDGTDRPVYTIPNNQANANAHHPRWQSFTAYGNADPAMLNWQRIDFAPARSTKLAVAQWNVGMLNVFVKNGGIGGAGNIATAIFDNDHICLNEIYDEQDRRDILFLANGRRAKRHKHAFTKVTPGDGDPPNEMILTSWIVVAHQEMKFMNYHYSGLLGDGGIPGAPDDNTQTGGLDNNAHTGAKGIVWARVAKPIAIPCDPCDGSPLKEYPSSTEWFDIFCMHTQAAYDQMELFDSDNQGFRDLQFASAGEWITWARGHPYGASDGFSRPALLMGDLNQPGPKRVETNWDQATVGHLGAAEWVLEDGMGDFTPQNPAARLAGAYQDMREKLNNWHTSVFDKDNKHNLKSYDLTANLWDVSVGSPGLQGAGTWIGGENQAGTSDTVAVSDEVNPSYPNLQLTPRIDYIMVLPSTSIWPSWKFVWDTSLAPAERHAVTNRNYRYRPADKSGTLSDHAEVLAKIEFVEQAAPPAVNCNKPHRLVYAIGNLTDVWENDCSLGDDCATDWFIHDDWFHMFNNAANPGDAIEIERDRRTEGQPGYGMGWVSTSVSGIQADQGTASIPWTIHSPVLNPRDPASAFDLHMVLSVWDHDSGPDDNYDSQPEPGAFDAAIAVDTSCNPSRSNGGWKVDRLDYYGNHMQTVRDFDDSGHADFTMGGNGDGYIVTVDHHLWMCETDAADACIVDTTDGD